MVRRTGVAAALMVAVAGAGLVAAAPAAAAGTTHDHKGCTLPTLGSGATYRPVLDRSGFGPNVTNPWFPLKPGRVNVYVGVKDGKRAVNVFAPTSLTRVVDGVRTRVVQDRLYLDGRLAERTADYYAQDRCGNVWYFGETTATLDARGKVVSTDGTFLAGVGGAQPGVYMPARPRVGTSFRQEWFRGHAEDVFTVLALDRTITVPYGSFAHALRTKETTALEPGVLDTKYYVRGIGEVVEKAVKGPAEALRLVEVIGTR